MTETDRLVHEVEQISRDVGPSPKYWNICIWRSCRASRRYGRRSTPSGPAKAGRRRDRRSNAGRSDETDGQPLCFRQMLAEQDETAGRRNGQLQAHEDHSGPQQVSPLRAFDQCDADAVFDAPARIPHSSLATRRPGSPRPMRLGSTMGVRPTVRVMSDAIMIRPTTAHGTD
jgi:hypothetical protein